MYSASDVSQLSECLQSVVHEQQELCGQAAGTTLSLQRLQQRLTVLERYFMAAARHRPPKSAEGGAFSKSSPTRKKQNAQANLSKQKTYVITADFHNNGTVRPTSKQETLATKLYFV